MASIHKERRGNRNYYRLQFYDKDNRRRSIRLGGVTKKAAESIRARVEDLLSASISGCQPSGETVRFLSTIGQDLAAKLTRAGFGEYVPERRSAMLGKFLDQYIEDRKVELADNTINSFRHVRKALLDFFDPKQDLRSISEGDADDWRLSLVERYAEATLSKLVKRAKQIFRSAQRKGLVDTNPFAEVVGGSEHNESRMHFVDRKTIAKVIEACPDAEWRLIVALARFGGLRTPSEILSLRWDDINWKDQRMTVLSPKTKKQGKPWRIVPLFPELQKPLDEAFQQAPEKAEHVISRYRQANCNLRTQFGRILKRAGVESWPRMFQNLRASRETELANSFPLHVVTSWLGNTPRVAEKHYLSTTEDHYRQAVTDSSGATGGAIEDEVVQQPVLSASDTDGQELPQTKKAPGVTTTSVVFPEASYENLVPPQGTELVADSSGKKPVLDSSGATGGAIADATGSFDADLQAIIYAWPTLSNDIKKSIVALVQKGGSRG